MPRCAVLSLVVGCALLAAGTAAWAVDPLDWPSSNAPFATDQDPIASLRWDSTVAWTSAQPASLEPLLRRLDAQLRATPSVAALRADRAVVLRAMGRFDEARDELDRAVAQDHAVLDDPDVGLTRAYLTAQAQHFDEAVADALDVLPRLVGLREARVEIALEVARWSMARGTEGLPDALAVLREATALGPPDPMVRATLALALARQGRTDEAREVARGGLLPLSYAGPGATHRGSLTPGEADAAVGVALWLAGQAHEAVEPLARAATTVPPPWRAQTTEALALARRSPAVVSAPAVPHARGPRR
jgi:tetratricopeptide (TPR) repeat protein